MSNSTPTKPRKRFIGRANAKKIRERENLQESHVGNIEDSITLGIYTFPKNRRAFR